MSVELLQWLAPRALVLVVVVFTLLLATTYWPSRRARYERDAMIPLQDDR